MTPALRKLVNQDVRKLTRLLILAEGKKSSVAFGDGEEVVGLLSDLFYFVPGLAQLFYLNGLRRSVDRRKKGKEKSRAGFVTRILAKSGMSGLKRASL